MLHYKQTIIETNNHDWTQLTQDMTNSVNMYIHLYLMHMYAHTLRATIYAHTLTVLACVAVMASGY